MLKKLNNYYDNTILTEYSGEGYNKTTLGE